MNTQQILAQEKAAYAKVEPPCPYFGACGGCALQDLTYADQLALKRGRLTRAFASIGYVAPIELIGLDDPWRYRNKAELTFGAVDDRMVLGYHAARSFWRIVDIDDCLLLPREVTCVLRETLTLAAQTGLPAYHPRSHQGFFRHLLVRSSHATGKVLLCLITAPGSRDVIEDIATKLMERCPQIASFYWGTTSKLADIAVPDELTLLRGEPYLKDKLGQFMLQLHPLSFLQPASAQEDLMYTVLCEALGLALRGVAWDVYCGLGIIGFYLASRFQTIYGIDVEEHHLELARHNASINALGNIDFRVGRAETLLQDRRFWLKEGKPDVVVVDPPRAGLHPQVINSVLAARPVKIGYLSCNANSLVRDLGALMSSFPRYRLSCVRAFDMFPQTNHVEILTVLERA
jgi:23S rRNA (uracil1939-C5)-methyltransferase